MAKGLSRMVISSRLTALSSTTRQRIGRSSAAAAASGSALAAPSAGDRQVDLEPEGRALADDAVDADPPAHGLDDLLGDRQAQARAAELARDRGVGLGEAVEQRADAAPRRCRCRCRSPRSACGSGRPRNGPESCDRHAAFAGELDGVGEEVEQHLAEARRVADQERRGLRRPRCGWSAPAPCRPPARRRSRRPSARWRPDRRARGSSSKAPASSLEKSSTSPTTPSRVWLASWIRPAWRASCAGQRLGLRAARRRSRWMAVSGVRSSWVMLARKSVLAAAAASERASASFSSASSALRWPTSRETPSRRPLAVVEAREGGLGPDRPSRPWRTPGSRGSWGRSPR